MERVYLLTGRLGSGKTSLIRRIVAGLKIAAGGFYTEEIRNQGVRQGFRLVTLDGQEAVLAHVNIRSANRVSKYGVDIDTFERVGVSALRRAAEQYDLIIVDEIGKMELFSTSFKQAISAAIDSGKYILGTIMLSPDPWADSIKRRPEVKLLTVTRANHKDVLEELSRWLESMAARNAGKS